MPSKVEPNVSRYVNFAHETVNGVTDYHRQWVSSGSNAISYDSGRKLASGHWPWKECIHTRSKRWLSMSAGTSHYRCENPQRGHYLEMGGECLFGDSYHPGAPSIPSQGFDEGAMVNLMRQIDLNSTENVLLYSGVLQAVPLVGGAMKLTSVLNRAARNLSKSFRKKPFTTVVKSLISADFIDRFVVSPMIDDARRFADATNYVLRVLETARQRSAGRFALQSSVKTVTYDEEGTFRNFNPSGYCGTFGGTWHDEASVTSKAFMLLEARYDLLALDPIKIWAQRVGLTRPLDSVWDLVPFSFVIDYFTRAGDFISALSDEMSNVEGLKGRITRIHDLWGSCLRQGKCTWKATSISGPDHSGSGWVNTHPWSLRPGAAVMVNDEYTRFRVQHPYTYLLSLQERLSDYLTLNLDLSSTRKRTIAELIIQAKL